MEQQNVTGKMYWKHKRDTALPGIVFPLSRFECQILHARALIILWRTNIQQKHLTINQVRCFYKNSVTQVLPQKYCSVFSMCVTEVGMPQQTYMCHQERWIHLLDVFLTTSKRKA